ncbi:MAG: ImmA/IrrE family metallo-endopeptidase [Oligoflexia bacterium]|nr:ImmA/IrrE family metallo-endopeptidase [Oligoflexia bacterium]
MKDIIGRRIKEERNRQNLTQEELINKAQLDWDRQTLGQIEKGERELKAWELARIAKVLHVDLPVFFPETLPPIAPKRPIVLWREKPENHEGLEAEFVCLCKDYKFVEELNKIDSDRFLKLPRKKIDLSTFSYSDAYALAEEVREQLGVGDYPAASLVKILEEKYGIKFFFNELGGNGSAASSASEYGLCILISSSEPAWRQHFSIAHELFHIITWDDSLIEQIDGDKKLREYNEKLANSFAAGLLVPTESLQKEIRSLPKLNGAGIVSIAIQFGVSLEALLWRMARIHIIDNSIVEKALTDKQLRSLDSIIRTEIKAPYYLSNRFVRLAYLACENGEISRARLAKMLNQSLSAIADYLKNFGLAEVLNNEITISNT